MARIGENIQAGLGRVDYSPLAQGIIAGGQARAQGIASLGQSAASAITAYFKRKEEDQRISSEIQSLKSLSQRPGGKAILEPLNIFKDDGSFDDATAKALIRERGLNGVVTLGSALKDLERQAKLETTNKKAIDYSSILEVGGGNVPAPYSNDFIKKGFTPEERALGKDIYVKQATAQAQLGKTLAETQSLLNPTPKEPNNEAAQIQREAEAFTFQTGRKPNAIEFAQIGARVRQQNSSQTNINVGERGAINALDTLAKSKFVPQSEKIGEYVNQANSLKVMESLLNSGVVDKYGRPVKDNQIITGWLAGTERDVKSALNKIGLANFKDVAATDVYLNAAYKQLAAAVQAFGSGTAISDTDLKTAARVVAGDLTVEASALREMLKNYKVEIAGRIQRFNKSVDKTFTSTSPEIENTASFYRNAFVVPETDYQYFLSTGAGEGGMFDEQGNALGVGGKNAALESGEYEIVNGRVVRKKK